MPRANKNVIIASEDTCQEMNRLTVIMKTSTGWPPLKIVSPHRTQSESFDTEHWNTGIEYKTHCVLPMGLLCSERGIQSL